MFSRLRQLGWDWLRCTPLAGGPLAAYCYLRAAHKPEVGMFKWNGLRFSARKEDWPAVREVILDDEYACVEWLFSRTTSPKILDLGANIGTFGLRMFRACPNAQVVSLEPAYDTFEILESNCRANPSVDWKVFNCGIWDRDCSLSLQRRGISLGHRVVEGTGGESVEVVSLPSLLTRIAWNHVDCIKMDIEGGEESVVPAIAEFLSRVQSLIIEIHSDRINSRPVMDALRALYEFRWQINASGGGKQVYLMTHHSVPQADLLLRRD